MSNISKVFDGLFHNRINGFAEFNLLYDNQYGFRKGKNTELAAIHLIRKMMPAFELGCYK